MRSAFDFGPYRRSTVGFDRQFDPVIVVAELDQVERRIVFLALTGAAVFEHVEQPVEADGRTTIGSKIKSTTHVLSSLLSNKAGVWLRPQPRHRTQMAPGEREVVRKHRFSRLFAATGRA